MLPSAADFLRVATPPPSLFDIDLRRLGVGDHGTDVLVSVDPDVTEFIMIDVLAHMKWKVLYICHAPLPSFSVDPM